MGERKRVPISGKPSRRNNGAANDAAEAWVAHAPAAAAAEPAERTEAMKRLTIDVPESLHTRMKAQCAMERVKMVDVIRALLAERFPETPAASEDA